MSNHSEEKTFRSYSKKDAAQYAEARWQYSDALYQTVISHHTSTGGKLDTVVDIGCGPGLATFRLVPYFSTVIGLDPSEGMISEARSALDAFEQPGTTSIRFETSTAEDISSTLIPDGSVDLITAATCAHWFDMERFWSSVARILRPGGTVALWCSNSGSAHKSVPNADKINAAVKEIEEKEIVPYLMPGNLLTRNLYEDIGLPWTVHPPVPDFSESTFFRKVFGNGDDDTPFFDAQALRSIDLDTLEKLLATGSPITRWRQDHPEAVGTEEDVIKRIRRVIEMYLHEAGVEKGKETIIGGTLGVLLMVKKRE